MVEDMEEKEPVTPDDTRANAHVHEAVDSMIERAKGVNLAQLTLAFLAAVLVGGSARAMMSTGSLFAVQMSLLVLVAATALAGSRYPKAVRASALLSVVFFFVLTTFSAIGAWGGIVAVAVALVIAVVPRLHGGEKS